MPTLRIVSINDVYSLQNLPRLKTLIAKVRSEGAADDRLLVILAGDFLSPSLLSSLDAGRGMVDCLNALGLTHIILGNHEDDLPPGELRHRLAELTMTRLGTNVSGLNLATNDVVTISDSIRVGVVGVVMSDAAVYRGPPFGGASVRDANEAAIEEAELLLKHGSSAIVAITHQSTAADRELARRLRAPTLLAIIGGHEHTQQLIEQDGVWIVKSGSEATAAAITEISFPPLAPPVVTTRLEPVSGYAEDVELRARVDRHLAAVRELSTATLLYVHQPLSSVGTRSAQTSLGTLICARLRDALDADACVFNGGGIRGQRVYPDRITYGDIESEVPFDNEVVIVRVPGHVLRDAIQFSRANAPAESGAFLQVDDRMMVDADNKLQAVNGLPLDPTREYRVAMVRELLLGLDHIEPLVRWAESQPEVIPPAGCGREPKMLLVQAFALSIWRALGGFDGIDANKDERVTPSEIARAISDAHPSQAPANLLADLVFRAVDVDADQIITRADATAIDE